MAMWSAELERLIRAELGRLRRGSAGTVLRGGVERGLGDRNGPARARLTQSTQSRSGGKQLAFRASGLERGGQIFVATD